MWKMMTNMLPANRMSPGRRNRGMNTATAMLVGAGIGIATWEMMRRSNAIPGGFMKGNKGKIGKMVQNAVGDLGSVPGTDSKDMAQAAKEVLDTVTK